MTKPILGLVVAIALFATARFYIFRIQDKEIAPGFYERAATLDDLSLSRKQIPSGFRLLPDYSEGEPPSPSLIEHAAATALSGRRPEFPAPSKVQATRSTAYKSALGETVVVVVSSYEAAPEPPAGFRRWDACLATAVAPSPLIAETFLNAIGEKVAQQKKDSVRLNKLKTVGNVLLKLFMDLMVGGFLFILALYLVKYFLIYKRVEE